MGVRGSQMREDPGSVSSGDEPKRNIKDRVRAKREARRGQGGPSAPDRTASSSASSRRRNRDKHAEVPWPESSTPFVKIDGDGDPLPKHWRMGIDPRTGEEFYFQTRTFVKPRRRPVRMYDA